ncbi:hypothetical protein [Malaciobacter mytili]|nr:hypothetical protein [Malaciobacter mytili]
MIKNCRHIFHIAIIAGFLLFLSGCGYKADPVYVDSKKEASK